MRRVEDERLITGRGRFAGDLKLDGLVHVAFCRSTLPHARIQSIDTSLARSMPGVIAVWTASDLPELEGDLNDWTPQDMESRGRPILNRSEVNYVGESFAMVVAESAYEAQDAAETVMPEMHQLAAAGDVIAATASGAPTVHADMKSNVARTKSHAYGDIKSAFAPQSVTAKVHLTTARVAGAAMEPRTVTAALDPESGGLRVWTSTQNVFGVREAIAGALGLDEETVRVAAEDVGGGFGAKGSAFPEEVLPALAAWRLKRPAQWIASRSEDGATTAQGHGSIIDLEIAADRDGKVLGIRGRLQHDLGAYAASGSGQPDIIVAHMLSAYVLPAMQVESQLVYTNTVPSGFIRGGGRPVGNYAMERVMDQLARRLNVPPVELRRRNLVQPEQIPFTTGYPGGRRGLVYDSGDYPRLLGLAEEKLGAVSPVRDGRLIGVGFACCVESTSFGGHEPARLRVDKDGSAHLYVGSTPQGQGHQTMAAQVAADRLGWPIDRIEVTVADTKHVPSALLTAGSRSAVQVGNATAKAATSLRRQLLDRAGEVLEADPADLVLEEGVIGVRGSPSKSVPATEVVPAEGLEVLETFDPHRPNAYASGCHAAAVAVHPETGQVEVLRYVIAHDTGRAINELIVEGQMHGGYAHGLGYALFEAAIYDPDGGYRTPTFLDYSIVSTGEVTPPELVHIETPTDANPEGFKGAGESGTIPVPAAISSAVEDALRKRRPDAVIDHLPITSDRIVEILKA